ncbi:hypothetical protein JOY44_02390 [Phormidium sp. CLA17]|uniref:hypothetical protein n=1 Tax=Leptolyngbya sp. Cla-17 TaxID=2803751 RepID=UPI001490E060|nr:hypothetical protein [Leptolyngbya sp. Cla-17]MBM0740474.1 hypothetical protein [Leptolyngbya sp. Cla-17]
MLFRLVLLLAIVGAMTLFTLQNLTPVLPLVFLGSPTPALPLSWWILGAIATGALTTLAITFLVGLSNFLTGQVVRSQVRSSSRRKPVSEPFSKTSAENRTAAAAAASQAKPSEAEGDAAWQDWRGYETSSSQSAASRSATRPQSDQNDDMDDWEGGMSDDWDEAPTQQPRDRGDRVPPYVAPSAPPERDRFERTQQPQQGSASGSYSYSYREPKPSDSSKSDRGKSDRGRSEQVVDADFRVLVPPYRALEDDVPPPSNLARDPDSWFEEEEEGDERRSPR